MGDMIALYFFVIQLQIIYSNAVLLTKKIAMAGDD